MMPRDSYLHNLQLRLEILKYFLLDSLDEAALMQIDDSLFNELIVELNNLRVHESNISR